jgi:hypothetical protein
MRALMARWPYIALAGGLLPISPAFAEAPPDEERANDEERGGIQHPSDVALGLGYTLGGGMGVVATILGLIGLSEQLEAQSLEDDLIADYGERPCLASGDPRCAEVEVAYRSHRDLANPALWIGVGGAAVLVGTLIYHVASLDDPAVAVTPFASPDGGGVGLRARF